MSPFDRVPPDTLNQQMAYVAGATGLWSRLWRSICAAWISSKAARRNRCSPTQD